MPISTLKNIEDQQMDIPLFSQPLEEVEHVPYKRQLSSQFEFKQLPYCLLTEHCIGNKLDSESFKFSLFNDEYLKGCIVLTIGFRRAVKTAVFNSDQIIDSWIEATSEIRKVGDLKVLPTGLAMSLYRNMIHELPNFASEKGCFLHNIIYKSKPHNLPREKWEEVFFPIIDQYHYTKVDDNVWVKKYS